jgi:hypothetical protein
MNTMKNKLQVKSRWMGSVLFEYEKENNTIKETLIAAVKSGADLRGAYLRGADLRGADLSDADLSDAYLRDADLHGANLSGANLSDADLRGAYLRGADLRGADLSDAYLSDAYLRDAYLRGADLSGAKLNGADLRGANLSDADLSDAYLRGADLSGADLSDAKEIPYLPLACPSDGAFIGWKKVEGCLIQLFIPEDAKRCSATTQKCRCEFAKVLSIVRIENGEELQSVENTSHTPSIVYKVGEIVKPDSFDEDRWNECSHGIHFFINKQDALNY